MMRRWTDPRDGVAYEVRVLIRSSQIAFWSDRSFWRTDYIGGKSEEELSEEELEVLVDLARQLPLDWT